MTEELSNNRGYTKAAVTNARRKTPLAGRVEDAMTNKPATTVRQRDGGGKFSAPEAWCLSTKCPRMVPGASRCTVARVGDEAHHAVHTRRCLLHSAADATLGQQKPELTFIRQLDGVGERDSQLTVRPVICSTGSQAIKGTRPANSILS